MDDRSKKKLKDTKVGKWLREKAPNVLDKVGDLLPSNGAWGVVKNLIDLDPEVTHQQKLEVDNLIDQEMTKRWESDNQSDSWLAKHTRPLIVLSLVGVLFLFIILNLQQVHLPQQEA